MKYYELDKEEQQMLEDIEKGEFVSVKNLAKVKKELIAAAKNTSNKTRNVNLRIPERDLQKLKAKAAREGIPYQTLASSILHRYTNE